MDKTIEIILVVTVAVATAAIVLFLVQGEADTFGEFLGDQQEGANCRLLDAKYDSKEDVPEDQKPNDCDITSSDGSNGQTGSGS